jgi:uncharacterized integral membrane protein
VRTFGVILKWVILLPVLAVILLLAVANGQDVTVHLNPFNAADAVLKFDLPLYQVGFFLFALGVLMGWLVAWTSQLKHRRRARRETPVARPRGEAAEPGSAAGFLPRPERG